MNERANAIGGIAQTLGGDLSLKHPDCSGAVVAARHIVTPGRISYHRGRGL